MPKAVAFDLTELPGDVYRVSNIHPGSFDQDVAHLVDVDCAMTRDAAVAASRGGGFSGYSVKRVLGRATGSGWRMLALLAAAS